VPKRLNLRGVGVRGWPGQIPYYRSGIAVGSPLPGTTSKYPFYLPRLIWSAANDPATTQVASLPRD